MENLEKYLNPQRVLLYTKGDKKEVLTKLIKTFIHTDVYADESELQAAIFEREKVISTGIGIGFAVPHTRLKGVKNPALAIAKCDPPIAYKSIDNQPVHTIVMFVMPRGSHREYLKMLSLVVMVIKSDNFNMQMPLCHSSQEIHDLFKYSFQAIRQKHKDSPGGQPTSS